MATRGRPRKFPPSRDPTKRVCTKCGNELPLEAFNFQSKKTGARQLWCRECHAPALREHAWKEQGIDIDDARYEQLKTAQGGRCAICGRVPPGRLDVDHDHETQKVRALLCGKCNVGLGLFDHDVGVLCAAAAYVGKHRSI